MERLPDSPNFVTKLRSLRSEPQDQTFRRNEAILLMFLAGLLGIAIHAKLLIVVPFAVIALAFYGCVRPTEILLVTMALSPLTIGLTGDTRDHVNVVFSVSDVLYLFALPYVLWRLRSDPSLLKLDGLGFPALLYLVMGLISFALNLHFMHGQPASYFSAWLRTAQIVFVVPLIFSVTRWTAKSLIYWLSGYLIVSTVLATLGSLLFIFGERERHFAVLGFQKNTIGLSLMVAVLIALAGIIRPGKTALRVPGETDPDLSANEERIRQWVSQLRPWLIGSAILCFFGLVISLSRGSYVSVALGTLLICGLRRRPLLFLCLLVGGLLVIGGVQKSLSQHHAHYLTDFSPQAPSLMPRLTMVAQAKQQVRAFPYFGDGYRMRRENVPHNLIATILVESGIVGGILFVWTLMALFRLIRKASRAATQDTALQWFTLSLIACTGAILMHAQFDPFWRRGPLWLIWAGGGATISYLRVARRHITISSVDAQ